ncbi:hypothetical protein CC2G_011801 [Coprinopsis cinerea AmutBmut pab1-1]|nr:hypothetical protein CC2G_011801 [Coprinopsis cinerea AmutBmut pab1-1]
MFNQLPARRVSRAWVARIWHCSTDEMPVYQIREHPAQSRATAYPGRNHQITIHHLVVHRPNCTWRSSTKAAHELLEAESLPTGISFNFWHLFGRSRSQLVVLLVGLLRVPSCPYQRDILRPYQAMMRRRLRDHIRPSAWCTTSIRGLRDTKHWYSVPSRGTVASGRNARTPQLSELSDRARRRAVRESLLLLAILQQDLFGSETGLVLGFSNDASLAFVIDPIPLFWATCQKVRTKETATDWVSKFSDIPSMIAQLPSLVDEARCLHQGSPPVK